MAYFVLILQRASMAQMHRRIHVLGAEQQEEGVRVGGDLLFTGILAT